MKSVRATSVESKAIQPRIVVRERPIVRSRRRKPGENGKGKGNTGGREFFKCYICGGQDHTSAQCPSRNLHSAGGGYEEGGDEGTSEDGAYMLLV